MSGRGVTDAPGQWKIEARKERSVPWLAVRVLFGSWVKKKKKRRDGWNGLPTPSCQVPSLAYSLQLT